MAFPLNVDSSIGVIHDDCISSAFDHQTQHPFNISPELVLNFHRSRENTDAATTSNTTTTTTTTTTQQSTTTASQDFDYYLPLYHAALQGNWESAKLFLENDRSAATAAINRVTQTALHVAAGEGWSEFVEKMVAMLPLDALANQDWKGYTALHIAAVAGSLRAAVALVSKNPTLTNVLDASGATPLLMASRYVYESNYEVLWYLTMKTSNKEPSSPFTGPLAMNLVSNLLMSGFLDIVLYLLDNDPTLATATTVEGYSLLSLLSAIPSNFFSGNSLGFWESFIYSVIPVPKSYGPPFSVRSVMEDVDQKGPIPKHRAVLRKLQRLLFLTLTRITPSSIKRLQEAKHRHQCAVELCKRLCTKISDRPGSLIVLALGRAASLGIVEIVRIVYQSCPDLVWVTPMKDKYLIHFAVEHRQERVFNLFTEKNARTKIQSDKITNSGTILHLAAKLAPFSELSSVSGAALQMQREMKWFKEVEKLVHPYCRSVKNEKGKTARELFTEEHKKLAEAGKKWMKDTSNSCMIVSTLIATVVFTAAFTVPGGNNGETGLPIFLRRNAFLVFAISDALALFSSLTSVLMFLSILTARFAEEDFVHSLPKRLIIGLASLLLAIITMMVAFGATLSIVLDERLKWTFVPTVSLALVPVAIFTLLQLPLFIEMVRSTYGFTFLPQSPW